MYVCIRGGSFRPLHRDPQWSIVLTSYEAPHYVVFSNLLSLHLSLVQMLGGSLITKAWRVLRLRMGTPSRYGG
jgi:hypothetical protein